MSCPEKQLAIIRDVALPADYNTRYDLYFTDQRIAIVYMGSVDRYRYEPLNIRAFPSLATAVTPPLTYVDNREVKQKAVEEELSNMPLDQILKLSKKSCQYAFDEIEEFRLVWSKKPKFVILSEDCESKFTPNEEQFKELIDLISTNEPMSNKLKVAGNWKELQEILTAVQCSNCGVKNELDAVCCVNCGERIKDKKTTDPSAMTCPSCSTKNRAEASFCKQCGAALITDKTEEPTE